jgi:hypothetical protein
MLAEQERDVLLAALRELVACKDLHDSIERSGGGEYEEAEYRRRKPLAWAEARRLTASAP